MRYLCLGRKCEYFLGKLGGITAIYGLDLQLKNTPCLTFSKFHNIITIKHNDNEFIISIPSLHLQDQNLVFEVFLCQVWLFWSQKNPGIF